MADNETTTQMPRPSQYHAKLSKLAGRYEADETTKQGPARGRMTARLDLGGFWLVMDYSRERGGEIGYRAHGLFGYDPGRRMYCMVWIDNLAPSTHLAWGQYEGSTLIFQSQESAEGWRRYSYHFNIDHSHDLKVERSRDGLQWDPTMEGHYLRR